MRAKKGRVGTSLSGTTTKPPLAVRRRSAKRMRRTIAAMNAATERPDSPPSTLLRKRKPEAL